MVRAGNDGSVEHLTNLFQLTPDGLRFLAILVNVKALAAFPVRACAIS